MQINFYMSNSQEDYEQVHFGTSKNNIPFLWFKLFTVNNLKSNFLITTKEQAIQNLGDYLTSVDDDLLVFEIEQFISQIKLIDKKYLLINISLLNLTIVELEQLIINTDQIEKQILLGNYESLTAQYGSVFIEENTNQIFLQNKKVSNQRRKRKLESLSITNILICINVGVYIYSIFIPLGIHFYLISGTPWSIGVLLSIVLAGFTHANISHIAFNMLFLYIFGNSLEKMIGKSNFLIVYFITLIGSGLIVWQFADLMTVTVGASGALYGLLGFTITYLLFNSTNNYHRQSELKGLLVLLAINIVFSVFGSNISLIGHLSGLIFGIITYGLFELLRIEKKSIK